MKFKNIFITDTESSSASNENENSTEKEDQLHAKESQTLSKEESKYLIKNKLLTLDISPS